MRPRAGVGDSGARLTLGGGIAPNVEATMDEVKDAEGKVINPMPGTKASPDDDYEVQEYGPQAIVELGLNWGKRYEAGLSSSRGLFFMWDYAVWEHAALTLTPSYSSVRSEGGDPKFVPKENAEGKKEGEFEHSYEGRAHNLNLTQLASYSVGNSKWVGFWVYGGVGANIFDASITGKTSDVNEKTSQVAPSMLMGLQLRLFVFELTYEAGATTIKYRDGTSKSVASGGVTLSLHLTM